VWTRPCAGCGKTTGLAAACTSTPGWGASSRHTGATAAVEGRCEPVLNRGGPADGLTARQVLIESFRACERAALADLDAIAGRRSLCSLSREGATVSAAKYHEGAAAVLAEARRAIEALAEGPDDEQSARAALRGVRTRWRTQARTRGRMGPDRTGYLTGGLDALEPMIDDDGGPDALDARN
jgi:hypothetical protein